MLRKFLLLPALFLFLLPLRARHLQPGFDGNEFRKMFQVSAYQVDTPWTKMWMAYPTGYTLIYRSPVSGLDNRWDLWKGDDSVDVISIRGTTASFDSWLENFYAGLIPANGSLDMEKGKKFDYHLADDSSACVHIGWMIGLANIAPDVVEHINSEYKTGRREFCIMGHSQGGAIGFLLTSYLYYQKGKSIPADVVFKTYGSGTPKPGNLHYSYDFDFITRGGWALRVVNAADWVPEVPFTLQTLNDLNKGSPFTDASKLVKGANFFVKIYAKHLVRKMNRSARRARKRFAHYLAKKSGKYVRKEINGFPKQQYEPSLNYAPCGVPIIMEPDAYYHKLYPDDGKSIFRHHGFGPYLYLLNLYYPVT
ncbi:MAG TPA: lipase family protein [Bacteroidia bacterium]|nr:lipase family protein [Bacteroidia bacterium]